LRKKRNGWPRNSLVEGVFRIEKSHQKILCAVNSSVNFSREAQVQITVARFLGQISMDVLTKGMRHLKGRLQKMLENATIEY